MSKQKQDQEYIEIYGAREHNLKNIDIKIPRDKLVVITGLSGSGKSSLAFDTIYAEGQRRYIESFSNYIKQYLGSLEKPDFDKIEGLSPVISIEQKTTSRSPRSTVGTITEIYDLLRLLYARIGTAYSYESGEKMIKFTPKQIVEKILKDFTDEKILVLAPIVKGRKGHYRDLFEKLSKQGYLRARIDGEIVELTKGLQVDRFKTHDIEVVVDRLKANEDASKRLSASVDTALGLGSGILLVGKHDSKKFQYYSRNLMCPTSGISYPDPEPNLFSFNSPYGACPTCKGIGSTPKFEVDKIIPNRKLSIKKGGIVPLGKHKNNWVFTQLEHLCSKSGVNINTPLSEFSDELIQNIVYGDIESDDDQSNFPGIINILEQLIENADLKKNPSWIFGFANQVQCTDCKGSRINEIARSFKVNGKSLHEIIDIDITDLEKFISSTEKKLKGDDLKIGGEIIKELSKKTSFLLEVGLYYISINRSSKTLSGGESQRIRLASQIGSELVGVLYILDEPSIGLHQRDNVKLIKALQKIRDNGNSVLVVEHDKEMIESADHVIDIGPGAGVFGGEITEQAEPKKLKNTESLTVQYLTGKREIEVPKKRRKGNGKKITIKNASGNNLKNVSISIPLGTLTCITGVSGSGKSTLINETLFPILNQEINKGVKLPLPFEKATGINELDKVIQIDQKPIGRTPRSNPVTYTGVFTDIRTLFSMLPQSKIRGFNASRFSFNVKGGRCEDCKGAGIRKVEMNFLPDVYVKCETCDGKRFNKDTLKVKYKGKDINDILNMSIKEGVSFFEKHPKILRNLATLNEVGLGYINLGQPSTTLSGGEAQRIKLASELSKRDTGKTLYLLDEPTTGLHFEDIKILMEIVNRLTDKGNTFVIIEHNLDVVKLADYVIDIGPEGGKNGGKVVAEGTPEKLITFTESITGTFLKKELNS